MDRQANPAFAQVWQLFGYDVVDSLGASVGPVNRIWTDNPTGTLQFIGLETGHFWGQTRVVPAVGAYVDEGLRTIRVSYPASRVQHAPKHNTDVPLTIDQESMVYSYYDKH